MKIGVISDTHNYLDPAVRRLFRGVHHIVHGGDVGRSNILSDLEEIAPVTAVCGNTDDPAYGYRMTELVELGGLKFLVHHIVNPHHLSDTVRRRMDADKPDVVVFGHTHKPFCEWIDGRLFLNPGYAGKQRFALSRSVALLDINDRHIEHKYLSLD